MNRTVGVHALDERDVVDASSDVRKEITHPRAALTVLTKLPLRSYNAPFTLVTAATFGFHRDGLPVVLVEIRLVIKGIDVAGTAVTEEEDDALRFARKHRGLRGHGVVARDAHSLWQPRRSVEGQRLLLQETIVGQQPRERDRGERATCLPQKLATSLAAESVERWLVHGNSRSYAIRTNSIDTKLID